MTRPVAHHNEIDNEVALIQDPNLSEFPDIVWTGTEYGVAWTDDRDGTTEIYFARVDASGNKIGQDLQVSVGGSDARMVSLVWTGSEYGMAWRDGEARRRSRDLLRSRRRLG